MPMIDSSKLYLDTVEMGRFTPGGRFNPTFFEEKFVENERRLIALGAQPLGQFIPEELPDGSKGITYGQVGAREMSPRGSVRYLQVINIRDTGIDFAIKPDRVAEHSHNDPERSRVQARDILFTNNAFRGTDTLLGRCVVVPRDYGKLNISQHIDRIRVVGINPFYVCCFLKSPYGSLQVQRHMLGVDSSGISFGRIRDICIPDLPKVIQDDVERQYLEMATCHDRAMAVKDRLLEEEGIGPGQYGEKINKLAEESSTYRRNRDEAKARLQHLLTELVAVIEGRQKKLKAFPS
jgi:hypothetical protein